MRIDILGVGFDNLTMTEAVARGCELLAGEGAHYVVTPNPEIVETCRADAEAMAAVNGADLVLPDGIGVIYGAKLLGTPLKSRVPGIEFGTAMLAHCAETGKRVYLFGAKPGVAEQAAKNLCEKLPGLQIAGTHDGYFTDAESDVIAAGIRTSGADMALVCLARRSRRSGWRSMARPRAQSCCWVSAARWMCSRVWRSARRNSTASTIWSGSTGSSKIRPARDA